MFVLTLRAPDGITISMVPSEEMIVPPVLPMFWDMAVPSGVPTAVATGVIVGCWGEELLFFLQADIVTMIAVAMMNVMFVSFICWCLVVDVKLERG